MKRLGKWLLRVIALAAALMLCAALWPTVGGFLRSLFAKMDYTKAVTLLNHEMREVGKLTTLEYSDEGVMTNTTDAFLLGTVQKVSVPYRYDISLGVDLEKAKVTSDDTGVTIYLPDAELILDKLTVTGEAQIDDFWQLMNEQRYQNMLDAHEKDCREAYMNDPETLARAWSGAEKALDALLQTWLSGEDKPPVTYRHLVEYPS